jgi:hypothetical protein
MRQRRTRGVAWRGQAVTALCTTQTTLPCPEPFCSQASLATGLFSAFARRQQVGTSTSSGKQLRALADLPSFRTLAHMSGSHAGPVRAFHALPLLQQFTSMDHKEKFINKDQ